MNKTDEKLKHLQKSLEKAKNDLLALEKDSSKEKTDKETARKKFSKANAKVAGLLADVESVRAHQLKKQLEKMLDKVNKAEAKAERRQRKADKALQKLRAAQSNMQMIKEKYEEYQIVASRSAKAASEKRDLAKLSAAQDSRAADKVKKAEVTNIDPPKETGDQTAAAPSKQPGRAAAKS